VFGLSLSYACRRDGHHVPLFFKSMMQYLRQPQSLRLEGLFRLSSRRELIDSLKKDLDRGNEVDLNKLDPNTVSGLLKLWLKSLPYPLLLSKNEMDSYNSWISTTNESNETQFQLEITHLMTSLPEHNQFVAKKLFTLLSDVSAHQEQNKMSHTNLAVVFSPLLLHPRDEKFQVSLMRCTNLLEHLKRIIQMLITARKQVFAHIKKGSISHSLPISTTAATTTTATATTPTTSSSGQHLHYGSYRPHIYINHDHPSSLSSSLSTSFDSHEGLQQESGVSPQMAFRRSSFSDRRDLYS